MVVATTTNARQLLEENRMLVVIVVMELETLGVQKGRIARMELCCCVVVVPMYCKQRDGILLVTQALKVTEYACLLACLYSNDKRLVSYSYHKFAISFG